MSDLLHDCFSQCPYHPMKAESEGARGRVSDPEVGRQRDRLDQHLALASATSCNTTLRNPSRPHHTKRVHQASDSCLLVLLLLLLALTAIKCFTMCAWFSAFCATTSLTFPLNFIYIFYLFCFGPYVALGSAVITKIVYTPNTIFSTGMFIFLLCFRPSDAPGSVSIKNVSILKQSVVYW